MNENNPIQSGAAPQPPGPPLVVRPVYEAGDRERIALCLCLCLGVLAADLLLSVGWNLWGLGIPAGVAAWYAVLFWYVGADKLAASHTRLFFGSIVLLALTFVFFSDGWFRFWNTGLLLILLTVHAFELSGAGRKPWYLPSMLWERFRLLLDALFGRLGALGAVFRSFTGSAARRGLVLGLGALATGALLLAAAALLGQADMVFHKLTAGFLERIWDGMDVGVGKLLLGLLATPFLFSLLYALGRPRPLAGKKPAKEVWRLDGAVSVMVLAGLDALYLFFIGVQSAALFGGEEYLAKMGISYAEYARSGFFQLTFVTVLNLAVVLALLQLSGREGRLWRAVQVLSTLLAALSGVILVSAGWRMTLYVLTYGLSFKRALTYWGMVMMALLLGAVCVRVWKEGFRFFRFAAVAVLAGWLALNYAGVGRVVAGYNVGAYLSGQLEQLDLVYLSELPYEALPVLEEKLDGEMEQWGAALAELLEGRSAEAKNECSRWETWSLPAWAWSKGK